MYNTLLPHPQTGTDHHPCYISETNSSSSPVHSGNYSNPQSGRVLRNSAYSYNHSAPLTAQESYQRTYMSDPIAHSCRMSPDSRSAPSTHPDHHRRIQSYHEDDNHIHGYSRADHTIYPATLPESAPYDFSQSFDEYGMQPPTYPRHQNPPTSTPMLQVFPMHGAPLTNAAIFESDVTSSTFTFQLGPRSLDQVEDLESLTTRSLPGDLMEEVFEENERQDSLSEPRIPGSPSQLYHEGTLSETETLPLIRGSSRRRSIKRLLRPESTKRSKMHQCKVCQKWFPRPSGLATHMNSHSGLRPFDCPLPTCNKSFAVRSNAKRHLRTHGIIPSPESPHKSVQYTVGFDTPLVTDVHEMSERPTTLRWIPQSLTSRTNVEWSGSMESESDGEDGCPTVSVPLVSANSPSWESGPPYEEVNSHDSEVASQPYHPRHWRGLPGPAL